MCSTAELLLINNASTILFAGLVNEFAGGVDKCFLDSFEIAVGGWQWDDVAVSIL